MRASALDHDKRVLEAYDLVLDVPAEERAHFIEDKFGADPSLMRALERMAAAEASADPGIFGDTAESFAGPMLDDLERRLSETGSELSPPLRSRLERRYTIEGKVGSGGMADVYLAYDREMKRKVAIKALRRELTGSLTAERFDQEVEIAARLDHPRIVQVYDRGAQGIDMYYVMRFVNGPSLRERLGAGKQLDLDEALTIARQIAEALDHAHANHIVHRDVKPENILLDDHGAYLADFGAARILDAAGRGPVSQTGVVVGTVAYMSPEQIENSREIDARTDVYSLACVLYEMLAGEPPYVSSSKTGLVNKHLAALIPDIRLLRPAIPGGVQAALAKGLAKRSENRPVSASHLVTACQRGITAAPEVTPTIAVLPFTNLSGDQSREYFSDGVTEELIDELTRRGSFRVVPSTSCFALKGQPRDIREIGVVLGASHILEGSIRIAGPKLRVTARLVNAADGILLWSEKFDRGLEDVFAVQDEITNVIVQKLHTELGGSAAVAPSYMPELPGVIAAHHAPQVTESALDPEADAMDGGRTSSSELAASPAISPALATPASMPSVPDPQRFEIKQDIAHGGAITAYHAFDRLLNREVSVAMLHPDLSHYASVRRRVMRHVRMTQTLEHPGILPVLEVVDREGSLLIITPHLRGTSLAHELVRQRQLEMDRVIQIATAVADALAHAHSRDIVHGDLKPANVFLGDGGAVFVLDFGVAGAFEEVSTITDGALVLGSSDYMAPERAEGGDITPAVDQYSLGCVVWEMLTGQTLYPANTVGQVLLKHLHARVPDPRTIRPAIPEKTVEVLQRMLSKNARDRFPGVREAADALSAAWHLSQATVTARPSLLTRIVGALRGRDTVHASQSDLSVPRKPHAARRTAKRFKAYDEYLRARYLLNFKSRVAALEKAIVHLDTAIAENPEFESAYAARAHARIMLARADGGNAVDLRSLANADATQALMLAPPLAEGHVVRALGAAFFDWDGQTAMSALERAISTNPKYADAHLWRGFVLNWLLGQPRSAARSIERALAFDPLSLAARVELTLAYWAEGDFHRSLKEANDAVFSGQTLERKSASSNTTLLSPEQKEIGGFSSAHYARSVVLAELGELDEAFEEARQAADVGGRMAANLGWLGHVCAKRGDANGALRIIAELLGRASRGKHVATALATVYVGLGDAADALKYLEQALEAREVNLVFVRHSRHFAELHAEPRFQKLLSSMRGGQERQ